jgi:hypothetical protein
LALRNDIDCMRRSVAAAPSASRRRAQYNDGVGEALRWDWECVGVLLNVCAVTSNVLLTEFTVLEVVEREGDRELLGEARDHRVSEPVRRDIEHVAVDSDIESVWRSKERVGVPLSDSDATVTGTVSVDEFASLTVARPLREARVHSVIEGVGRDADEDDTIENVMKVFVSPKSGGDREDEQELARVVDNVNEMDFVIETDFVVDDSMDEVRDDEMVKGLEATVGDVDSEGDRICEGDVDVD